MTNIWAIVPAAGIGARMQSEIPKQYLKLLDRPVILHTLERLCSYPKLSGVMAGIAGDDSHWSALGTIPFENFLGTYEGGTTRAQTVLNGLSALSRHAKDDDWVMVHDAVRPCVTHADLDKLVACAVTSSDGALLASPVADTVKQVEAENKIVKTVPRTGLWRALTPQMFPLARLRQALEAVLATNREITDESMAMEQAGARPHVVEGRPDNIKITHPSDLALAALFLTQQTAQQP